MEIIGLAGRKRSGKTELAKVCADNGYLKISFANPLKELSCKLLNVGLHSLNQMKNNGMEIMFNIGDKEVDLLSQETGIERKKVKSVVGGRTIMTVRELLQVIGTDLIRMCDPLWHVTKVEHTIRNLSKENTDVKIVIDDVRFPDERNLIEEYGGKIYFIVRPDNWDVSNHPSEIGIQWHSILEKENIIINDGTLNAIKEEWESFIKTGKKNQRYFMFCTEEKKYKGKDMAFVPQKTTSDAKFTTWMELFVAGLLLSNDGKHLNEYVGIDKETGLISISTKDLFIKDILYNVLSIEPDYNSYMEFWTFTVYNPFIVENLKLFTNY